MTIQEQVWNFLRNKNLPEKSVAAVMGNIEAESEFDSKLVEEGNGIGFGLCQWSYERRSQLESYGTDLNHQLEFLWAELSGNVGNTGASPQWTSKNGYISLPAFLSGDGSIEDLTAAMCFCWERPNAALAHLDRRQTSAQNYYNQFTGTSGPPSASGASSSQTLTIEATNYEVVANSQQQGDILYGRRYRITVSDSEGNAFDVSKLRCTFNVIKTIQMEPNMSQITIYNLNADTENKISTIATRVTVEAGYEGRQYGLIFDGDIIQTIRDKEDSTTFRLTIIALDSDRAINFEIANYSIAKGQTARTIVDHIVNKAEYPVYLGSISGSLSTTPALTRGKVFFGKASDYLRQIAESNDCKYYMDSGYLNLIKVEELPDGTILDLSPSSGLIGTPEQSEYGITGKALLNPNIKLNTLIHIDNSLVREKQISFTNNSNTPTSTTTATTGVRAKIIEEAKKLCDDPNVGYSLESRGQTINGITYYDCSLFVKHCYNTAGLELDDITNPQWQNVQNGGQVVDLKSAQAGDIVFWFNGDSCYHVAIYGGNSDIYAARSANKSPDEQVSYGSIYGTNYKIGRPASLVAADNGNTPSANGATTNASTSNPVYRALDRDGIYKVIKVTYEGDSRGDSWFANFETITQAGGQIPLVSN